MKTFFLDSINVNDHIYKSNVVDTIVMNNRHSIQIIYNDSITIFGNLDDKNVPNGTWTFTFSNDPYEFIIGDFKNGKRDGRWLNSTCAQFYKRGLPKHRYCLF